MNKKVSILIISIFLTLIVFTISTYMQKELVDYVPTMKCMIVNNDIDAYNKIKEEDIQVVDMPISIVSQVRVVQNFEEIQELYLKDKLYKGQVVLYEQFDTKENLMIYTADAGKEKIAIKIKASENAASFTVRQNSIVSVYATFRKEYENRNLFSGEIMQIGDADGYSTVKILDSIKVLGTFDSNGEKIENSMEKNIDTILLAVTPEEAQKINLIRDIATFNITELGDREVNI